VDPDHGDPRWAVKQQAVEALTVLPETCEPVVTPFVVTKEHRRFAEFADAVRRHRYIGLCYGQPGVGKTESARHYASWDLVGHYLEHGRYHDDPAPAALLEARTAFYTPGVTVSPRLLEQQLFALRSRLSSAIESTLSPDRDLRHHTYNHTELVVLDEADRLKTVALEVVRDHHDRHGFGLILIGMPGIEKRLARYPQLYSRVGFVHHYRPMSPDEQAFVMAQHWPALGLGAPADFTAVEALAAIARITNGNFRLTARLAA
jgi:DNA transposition AAA+ family ATPase